MTVRKTIRAGKPILVVDITYRKTDGRKERYRRDAQVQTMTAAKAEERRLLAELGRTGDIKAETLPTSETKDVAPKTFGDAIAIYREKKLPTLKHSTSLGYESILTQTVEPRLSKKELANIGKVDLADLDAVLAVAKTSPSWRRNVHVVVRAVLRTAVVHGLLDTFPSLPHLPKVGRVVTDPLSREQVEKVLAKASTPARLAFALAAYAGLRRGEIRGLRWPDVDLKAGTITVRRCHVKGVEGPPKSGHQRVIPIARPLRQLLEAAPRTPWGPVAPSGAGTIWAEASLLRNYQRACKRAGVPEGRFHSLRHFFVSELFRRGASARAVQDLAGHIHLATTQLYAAVGEQDRRDAIARLA